MASGPAGLFAVRENWLFERQNLSIHTYEEFAALLGSDSERASMVAPIRIGFFSSFMRVFGLSVIEARKLVVDDRVDLAGI
ncbi:hypothetical protein JCGZ_15411 [Jatropha curcas]|uniref:Uncharacterized protein n=1 Tax=Jatropha curcas TaxID=180498 RepID=A0A067KGX9_JATCU|nr:hypothetical protein JCGZ_15411 [Jatropha curcas]